MGDGKLDDCSAPVHPHHEEMGKRKFKIGKEVWIERTDYEETPPKGFFRLFPPHVNASNNCRQQGPPEVRPRHRMHRRPQRRRRQVTEVHATLIPDTKSGTPGSDAIKVKGNITWVGVNDAVKPKCACMTACSPRAPRIPATRIFWMS
jgi:glutaminyl-tRNA synthetase